MPSAVSMASNSGPLRPILSSNAANSAGGCANGPGGMEGGLAPAGSVAKTTVKLSGSPATLAACDKARIWGSRPTRLSAAAHWGSPSEAAAASDGAMIVSTGPCRAANCWASPAVVWHFVRLG